MKVKFLKNGPGFGFSYFAGEEANIPDEKATELLKLKVVSIAEDGASGCELPADIPHREELDKAGINSLEDLKEYEADYTKIKGIGEAKSKDIVEFLAKGE